MIKNRLFNNSPHGRRNFYIELNTEGSQKDIIIIIRVEGECFVYILSIDDEYMCISYQRDSRLINPLQISVLTESLVFWGFGLTYLDIQISLISPASPV